MATNFPGPYEVRIFYSVDTTPGGVRNHQTRVSCNLDVDPDPGDAFNTIDLLKRNLTTVSLDTAVDLLVTRIKPFFNSTDGSIDYAELWKYTPASNDAAFISSYNIAVAGTSTDPTVPASQIITTFRTIGSGIFKNVLLDTAQVQGQPIQYSDLASPYDDYADHFISTTLGYWVGRDNTYPNSCLALFPGQNEATFKSRFRP